MRRIPPVRRGIVVDATPEIAFKIFTERISHWWPMAAHSFGSARLDEATALATHDDASVASGFFRVDVRPLSTASEN